MGLFDFLKKPSQLTISLKEYGHASADWSINLAPSLTESTQNSRAAMNVRLKILQVSHYSLKVAPLLRN